MRRLSNATITIINAVTTAVSLAALGFYLYLRFFAGQGNPTHCQRTLQWPLLVGGLGLLAVSVLGLLGSWCRVRAVMWAYVGLIFLIILGWIVFSVFVFAVTNKGAGKAVSGFGFSGQARLGDYSHWLKKHVVNGRNWRRIRSCLVDANVCDKEIDFYKNTISPIQGGCCKPPAECGFTRMNSTYWEATKSDANATNPDCQTWSNDGRKLCYECSTCKAGVLYNIRKWWRHFAVANAVVLAILIIVYSVGCYVIRSDHKQKQLDADA